MKSRRNGTEVEFDCRRNGSRRNGSRRNGTNHRQNGSRRNGSRRNGSETIQNYSIKHIRTSIRDSQILAFRVCTGNADRISFLLIRLII